MPIPRTLLFLAATLGLVSGIVPQASAAVVLIEYSDRNDVGGFPDSGGPVWSGFVDTVANTLTITSWTELTGTPDFWTPLWTPELSALPMVWPAITSSGAAYDVPDSFRGHIDASFGFISPVSAQHMLWNEGTWGTTPSFQAPPEADFYPGWGGFGITTNTASGLAVLYNTAANEREMPLWPIAALGIAKSEGATVTATEGNIGVQPVPEASAFIFVGAASMAGLAAAVAARIRRRGGA